MKVRIYDAASGGTLQWSEERAVSSGTGVVIAGSLGLFSIQLGDVSSLPPSIFTNQNLYLEVELPTPATATCSGVGCASYTEGAMTPRNKFGSTAYAFNADTIDGIDGANLGQLNGTNVWTGPNQVKLNSGVALNVQNASSQDVLNVDTATSKITLGVDTTLAAGKSLTITGSGTRPASPTEGMVYYDTTTKQLLTYSNGKWQTDKSDAILVAASNSSQADKDAAQYVADGNTAAAADGDQVQINAALTAGAGKKVALLAGTYTADATILIPNNTTLAGVGAGTLVQLADIDVTDSLIENSDTTTGTGVVVRDLKLDGQKTLNTAGTQQGIYFNGMGDRTTFRAGGSIENVWASNFRNAGLRLGNSDNSSVLNNKASSNGYEGIRATYSDNIVISDNATYDNPYGISIDTVSSSTVSHNIASNNLYDGFFLTTLNGVIDGNSAVQNGQNGFVLNNSSGAMFSNNNAHQNTSDGVYLFYVQDSVISDNSILGNGGVGLRLETSHKNNVANNRIHDNGGPTANNGIYVSSNIYQNATSNIISGNYITDTSATTTNYAINISDAISDLNYLSNNRFSSTPGTSTINNLGTGTIYSNQPLAENGGSVTTRTANSTTAFQVQNAAGLNILTADTSNGEIEIGSAALAGKLVISDGSSNTVTIGVGALAGDYNLSIPTITANDTLCLLTLGNCGVNAIGALDGGTANATGATITSNTLYLQSASASYAGLVNTTTQTFAGAKTFNDSISLAAAKTISMAGGTTANRPASPTEGMIYFDTDTKQLLTYTNGKWQADGKDAVIVAASNSSAADKAAADYIADGTGDQTEINSALTTAAPGGTRKTGKVVLLGGTYTANATILIPNNTTLSGVGTSTLVQLADIDATDNLIENSDATTGTGIAIENLRLDGQKSLNTAGTQHGVYLSNMGAGNGAGARQGAKITNSTISNFRDSGLYLNASSNNNLAGLTTQSNGHSGLYVVASHNNTITGSNAQGNGNSGFYITASSNNSLTDNFSQGNANSGYLLNVGSSNTLTGNTAQGNTNAGFNIDVSSSNSLTGNTAQGNAGSGFFFNSSPNNTVSGNSSQANTNGFHLNASPTNTLTANTIVDSSNYGVFLLNSNNNTVTGTGIHNSGGAAANNAIYGDTADGNTITNNTITDTSATTTNYAINFTSSTSDQNYLADNRFSSTPGASTINDLGTGTVYANQARAENGGQLTNRTANSTTAFQIQNATGTSLFNVDTTNTELEIGSATTGVRLSSSKLNFGDGTGWTFDIAGGGGNLISLTDNSGIILRKDTTINGSNSGLLVTTGTSASSAVMASRSGGGATGNLLELQKSDGNVLSKFDVNGNLTVGSSSSSASTTALLVQNTSNAAIFSVDTTNSRVVIGSSSTTGVILVLGNKTTAGDPTGIEGSMYYNSSAKAFRCYENDGWRNCNSAGYETLDIKDEFMTGMMDGEYDSIDFQRHVGELNWLCDSDEYNPGVDTDYGCNINTSTEDAGHPGVVQLQTIHEGAASWSAAMSLRPIALADFDRATYIVRTQSAYSASNVIVGLVDDATELAYPNGGIYFEYNADSTVWRAKTKVGGVETNVSTGVSLANSTWYRLEIRKVSSTYYFYINGTQVATSSTNLPTAVQQPYFGVWNRNAVDEGKLRIDYFSMRSKTLSR